jgi:hypothetical protein
MSTREGDVLILLTAKNYTVFAVGRVSKDGQCDFDWEPNVQHTRRRDEALTVAEALLVREDGSSFRTSILASGPKCPAVY